ncbi:NfeD family protein [Leucothrix mucor]|uniref:NfeD family protein n=1 Tax=Leucothrix mucor TaxID=45248 RepID=UPI0003B52DFC|nr:NfeD family protein [Leucothrix mucor]
MEMQILYWHWIVLGIGLMAIEIVLPSFVALWFGAAAVLVGILVLIMPSLPLALQVLFWVLFAVLFTWLWFKYMQPLAKDRTKAGLSREAIVGETGQVLSAPTSDRRGVLRFSAPILGADEWQFICDDAVSPGDRVRVIDISGNSLIVNKV